MSMRVLSVSLAVFVAFGTAHAAPAPFAKPSREEERLSYEQLCRALQARGVRVVRVTAGREANAWRVELIAAEPNGGDVAFNPYAYGHSVHEVKTKGGDRRAALRALLKDGVPSYDHLDTLPALQGGGFQLQMQVQPNPPPAPAPAAR